MIKISSIPQIYRNVNRWGEILSILSKYGLADWISRFDLSLAKGLFKNRDGEVLATLSRESRIRLALEELGPTFIKLGQILSTRPDQIGWALADELSNLQGNVASDPEHVVRETVETELGESIEQLFLHFDPQPLASASIGQVHRAKLRSGDDVVVKVQHHGIQRRVAIDLDILLGLAQLAERLPELAPYRPRATVAEFQRALRRELDFGREERNLQQFTRDFAGNKNVRIPRTYPELSTGRVLTMEHFKGSTLGELIGSNGHALDLPGIARRGAEIYLEMIFTHGFYHADPHPGNFLLMQDGVLGLLDFGMVGRIEESMREDLEDMLAAIVSQDSPQLVGIVTRLGSSPTDLDETSLAADLADYVAHYANQPLEHFDLSGALYEMVEIMRRYRIVIPSTLAMLIKVLIMLEGTGRMLQPSFSLMEVIAPFQRRVWVRRMSPARHMRKLKRILIEVEQLAEVMPRRIREILQQVQRGKFDVHLDHRGLEPSVNRLVLGMLASALFLGSALMVSRNIGALHWGPVDGMSVPGAAGIAVSLALGLRLLRAINKSGHLDRQDRSRD